MEIHINGRPLELYRGINMDTGARTPTSTNKEKAIATAEYADPILPTLGSHDGKPYSVTGEGGPGTPVGNGLSKICPETLLGLQRLKGVTLRQLKMTLEAVREGVPEGPSLPPAAWSRALQVAREFGYVTREGQGNRVNTTPLGRWFLRVFEVHKEIDDGMGWVFDRVARSLEFLERAWKDGDFRAAVFDYPCKSEAMVNYRDVTYQLDTLGYENWEGESVVSVIYAQRENQPVIFYAPSLTDALRLLESLQDDPEYDYCAHLGVDYGVLVDGNEVRWLAGIDPRERLPYAASRVMAGEVVHVPRLGIADFLRLAILHLRETGVEEVATDEVLELLPEEVQSFLPDNARGKLTKIGERLSGMGVPSRRGWRRGERVTYFCLSVWHTGSESQGPARQVPAAPHSSAGA